MSNFEIIGSIWFDLKITESFIKNKQIGIVAIRDKNNNKLKYHIGLSCNESDEIDDQMLLQWGSSVNYEQLLSWFADMHTIVSSFTNRKGIEIESNN